MNKDLVPPADCSSSDSSRHHAPEHSNVVTFFDFQFRWPTAVSACTSRQPGRRSVPYLAVRVSDRFIMPIGGFRPVRAQVVRNRRSARVQNV